MNNWSDARCSLIDSAGQFGLFVLSSFAAGFFRGAPELWLGFVALVSFESDLLFYSRALIGALRNRRLNDLRT